MSSHWLVYWNWDTVQYEIGLTPAVLRHAGSAQFGKVQPGDTLWIVSIPSKDSKLPRDLTLVGRLRVALCTSDVYEALRFLGLDDSKELWEAPWHACATPGQAESLKLINLQPEAENLRFNSKQDRLTPVNGQINPQQLQTMRWLARTSVSLLERCWVTSESRLQSSAFIEFDEMDEQEDEDLLDLIGDSHKSGLHPGRFTGSLSEVEKALLNSGGGEYAEEPIPANDPLQFPEGRKVLARHLRAERSSALVKLAKERFSKKYGALYCEVCGFNFSMAYGDLGEGYIEAHHTIPVSQLAEGATTSPDDLAMLCANCHRMLHRSDPLLSVGDLQQTLRQTRQPS